MEPKLEIILKKYGQEGLLAHLRTLDKEAQQTIMAQLQSIAWEELSLLSTPNIAGDLQELKVLTLDQDRTVLEQSGVQAYRGSRVAVLMLAGGAGSRLGYDGPKGCFDLSMKGQDRTLYRIKSEQLAELNNTYNILCPFIILTSDITHDQTLRYFEVNSFFGLPAETLHFIKQPSVPVFSESGDLLLASEIDLLLSPNGNGGCYEALIESNLLNHLQGQGVEYLLQIPVDNLSSKINDPAFIGFIESQKLDLSIKLIEMQDLLNEQLASVIINNNQIEFVEYSERGSAHLAYKKNGRAIFRWGSPSLFCWRVSALNALAAQNIKLPYHLARKQAQAWIKGSLETVACLKRERFLFDLASYLQSSRVGGFEIRTEEEFQPLKSLSDLEHFAEKV